MGISALLASQILDASATGRSVITGADASAIRTTLGLGTLATQSPTGTPSASTFLRGDYSWQTIDLSGYVPYSGATGAVNLGSNAFTASRATLATGTITTSTPALNVTQTWNNAATTFTGILSNVTDTASNAASLFAAFQFAGVSRYEFAKTAFRLYNTNDASTANYERAKIAWESNVLVIGTEKAGTGVARNAVLVADGVNVLGIGNTTVDINVAKGAGPARLNFANDLAHIRHQGSLILNASSSSFGIQLIAEYSGSGSVFNLAPAGGVISQYYGTTSQSYHIYNTFTNSSNYERAKIAWESTVLRIGTEKAGTGSARALELQTDGTTRLTISTTGAFTIANALDIAVGTTTGTKIGTATTQKLGFFNATPVVQPTAVSDATDAASVITQLNALLSRMRNLGLIAT